MISSFSRGTGLSVEYGKQNLSRIGVDVEQRGNQHVGVDHGIKPYRPALAAAISALTSSSVICELPFARDILESFRIAAIASSAVGIVFNLTANGTPCS